jgi:hypothetical protein
MFENRDMLPIFYIYNNGWTTYYVPSYKIKEIHTWTLRVARLTVPFLKKTAFNIGFLIIF